MNDFIVDSLIVILNTYNSMLSFFYQKIDQTQYVNSNLAIVMPQYINGLLTRGIDYTLLLPSSEFILILNENQVNAQMQAYIDLCNTLVDFITNNVRTQTVIFYEQIQNQLNSSITQINGLATALLKAQYSTLFVYTTPYDMTLSYALFLNQINLNTYSKQVRLNAELADFNNIRQNTKLTFTR